jgi:hypothetical protein
MVWPPPAAAGIDGWHWQWRQRAFALEMTGATVRLVDRIIAFSRKARVTHRRTR